MDPLRSRMASVLMWKHQLELARLCLQLRLLCTVCFAAVLMSFEGYLRLYSNATNFKNIP